MLRIKSIYILKILAFMSFVHLSESASIPEIMDVTYGSKDSSEPVLVQRINLPGISADTADAVVIRALKGRKWAYKKLENGDIQAKLVHRSFDSTLTFKVMDGSIEIWSVSYEINKKTQVRKERDEPEGWIRNLHKDILSFLGLLS